LKTKYLKCGFSDGEDDGGEVAIEGWRCQKSRSLNI